jgi:hypothetical protein
MKPPVRRPRKLGRRGNAHQRFPCPARDGSLLRNVAAAMFDSLSVHISAPEFAPDESARATHAPSASTPRV